MANERLENIPSEMVDNNPISLPTDDAEQWSAQFKDQAPTSVESPEAPEATTAAQGTDGSASPELEAEATQEGPEVEAEPDKQDTAEKRRIARLANDLREKNRKLAMQQAEIDRLKSGKSQEIDDRLIDQKAEERLAVKEFQKATQAIYAAGMKSYGADFTKALDALNDVCNPDQINMLSDGIIAAAGSADGHLLVKHLGDNPDILEDIVRLAANRQGVELARLAHSLTAPKLRPVSKAPPPIKAVTTSTATTTANIDPMKMSMDEFAKWSLRHDIERGRVH